MKKTNVSVSEKARAAYYVCGCIATIISIVYVLKTMGAFKIKKKVHKIKIDDVSDVNLDTVKY